MDDVDKWAVDVQEAVGGNSDPASEAPNPDKPDANGARAALRIRIQTIAMRDDLAALGHPLSDADLASTRDELSANAAEWDTYTRALQDLLTEYSAAGAAYDKLPPPTTETVAEMYEQGVAAGQISCLRVIQTDSESLADEALAAINGGEPFAEVAGRLSSDQASAPLGGVVIDPSSGAECMGPALLASLYPPEVVDAALTATPGVAIGPIRSSIGFHLVLVRPWSEITDQAMALAVQASRLMAIDKADVTVDPSIGRWSATAQSVVTLDDPRG